MNFSHLCGLLLSFYFTKNIKTLKSTGESDSKHNLFHRYLQTIRHTQKWYEGDVWDPKDPAHKSLALVRSMHAKVANKMEKLNDGIVYVSQWDMAVTQWAFVGTIVLFRSKVGLHSCTEEQYESLIHFWRVIGYLLGIEDQYNLCTGDYEQVVAACRTLMEKEYRDRVAIADPTSVDMCKSVSSALNLIDPIITWDSMANYIHELVGVPCPVSLNYYDWICHWMTKFIMQFVLQIPSVRALFNDFMRWRLDMADKRDIEFKQSKKYILPPRNKAG